MLVENTWSLSVSTFTMSIWMCVKYLAWMPETVVKLKFGCIRCSEENPLMQVVNIVMAAMAPLMNLMCAAGIIKGILSIAVLCGLPSDSGYYQLFNAIGDAIFYFMPMLLGMNLAKKFAIDPVFGFLVGAAMLYPTIQGVDLNLLA